MKIAVTGAAGHVGSNLVRSLLEAKAEHRVRCFDRGSFESLGDLPVEKFSGDIRDESALARCFEGVDRVFHLAAIISIDGDQDGLVYDVNVAGARAAARAARSAGVGRFVHFSSIHAFAAHSAGGVVDEMSPRSGDGSPAYDRSKAMGEVEVRGVISEGLDGVIVHPTGVLGPPDSGPSRAGRGVLDAARGRLPIIINGGFDWVDVRDVAAGAWAAAERGRRGQSYILSGARHTLQEITSLAAEFAGVSKPLVALPRGLLRSFAGLPMLLGRLRGREPLFTAESLDTLGTTALFSCELAKNELGYQARPFEDTLRDLVAWFIESGRIPSRRGDRGSVQTRFALHLGTHPVDGPVERPVLARMLAEIAVSDGRVEVSERALLTQFANVEADEVLSGPAVSAGDVAALTTGQRESLLLAALALAWVDEEFSAVERRAVDRMGDVLGIGRRRAGELEDWAKEFLIDQLFDAVYTDGLQDAEERKQIEQSATRFDISPAALAQLDAMARKRRGLPPEGKG